MAAMNLELGPPEVNPELPQAFAAKPPSSPPANRVAILVAHGMGQQVPYETIDGVAQAAARGVVNGGGTLTKSVIRSVRMGTQGDSDLVRAEIQIREASGQEHEVHVYEAYWAPITEGKVSATDVVNFLFDAGWNGILNTTARTYRRWMFGAEQQFLLATEKLTFAFLGIMALLAALVFINSIAAAATASHALGSANLFPSGDLLAWLTWDFVLVDIAALLIAIGVFVVGRINPRLIAWIFIYLGASLIVIAAILMAGHLLRWPFFLHFVPHGGWSQFVSKYSLCIVALWTLEIWAASIARGFSSNMSATSPLTSRPTPSANSGKFDSRFGKRQ